MDQADSVGFHVPNVDSGPSSSLQIVAGGVDDNSHDRPRVEAGSLPHSSVVDSWAPLSAHFLSSSGDATPVYHDDIPSASMPTNGNSTNMQIEDHVFDVPSQSHAHDCDDADGFDDDRSFVAGAPFVPAHRARANRRMRMNIRRHRALLRAGYRLLGCLPLSADFINMLKR